MEEGAADVDPRRSWKVEGAGGWLLLLLFIGLLVLVVPLGAFIVLVTFLDWISAAITLVGVGIAVALWRLRPDLYWWATGGSGVLAGIGAVVVGVWVEREDFTDDELWHEYPQAVVAIGAWGASVWTILFGVGTTLMARNWGARVGGLGMAFLGCYLSLGIGFAT